MPDRVLLTKFVIHLKFKLFQKKFSDEAACEKITYTHVLSKGKTEEKHYGKILPLAGQP